MKIKFKIAWILPVNDNNIQSIIFGVERHAHPDNLNNKDFNIIISST